jgi:NAD(P)-dependent dehydrogenase (short-subunit alcohol dehydrogenase family)
MKTAVVTGSYEGLGALIALHLSCSGYRVVRWDKRFEPSVDVTSVNSVYGAASTLDRCDVLVNCAGINHLAAISDVDVVTFDQHMAVNARGMLLCTQALLSRLQSSNGKGGTVCNIISNASHMPMRMSLAYNASKAAAAMITRQMARELYGTHGVTVFGVSPNRMAGTPMSNSVDEQVAAVRGWTADEVRQRQLEALPIGEETDPNAVAELIGFLLSAKERHKYLHGAILEYGI